MNREIESAALRPLARGLTKTLDTMRQMLKEQCYENMNAYSDKVRRVRGGEEFEVKLHLPIADHCCSTFMDRRT